MLTTDFVQIPTKFSSFKLCQPKTMTSPSTMWMANSLKMGKRSSGGHTVFNFH